MGVVMRYKSVVIYCFSLVAVFVILFGFTVFSGMDRSEGRIASLFNIIFLVMMFLIILIFVLINLRKSIRIRNQLRAAANDLRQAKDWKKLSFSVPEIRNAYQTYLQEMERLTNGLEQRPVSCDIEDYIHEQLLNGLINKSLCESISGSMTGLGLLGTFLGLIIGLKDFSTDYDGIQNSILMLLNGIKTSFLTSIYGVVFSLAFNWMYRGCYTDMMSALYDFYQSFHDKAVQPAQNDMNSRLITALEHTGDCLDKILDSISGNITEAIRLCMQDVSSNVKTYVEDAYQLQQTSQETMVTGMEQYLERAASTQHKNLQTMVEQYLRTMSEEVLGGELAELRRTLDLINTSNEKHYETIAKLSDRIEISSASLLKLGKQYTKNVEKYQGYVTSVQQYQKEITEANQLLTGNLEVLSRRYDEQNQNIQELCEQLHALYGSVEQLSGLCGQLNGAFAAAEHNRSTFAASAEQLIRQVSETTTSVNQKAMDSIQETYEMRAAASEQLEFNIQALNKISVSFENTTLELSETYAQLTEKLNIVPISSR